MHSTDRTVVSNRFRNPLFISSSRGTTGTAQDFLFLLHCGTKIYSFFIHPPIRGVIGQAILLLHSRPRIVSHPSISLYSSIHGLGLRTPPMWSAFFFFFFLPGQKRRKNSFPPLVLVGYNNTKGKVDLYYYYHIININK